MECWSVAVNALNYICVLRSEKLPFEGVARVEGLRRGSPARESLPRITGARLWTDGMASSGEAKSVSFLRMASCGPFLAELSDASHRKKNGGPFRGQKRRRNSSGLKWTEVEWRG